MSVGERRAVRPTVDYRRPDGTTLARRSLVVFRTLAEFLDHRPQVIHPLLELLVLGRADDRGGLARRRDYPQLRGVLVPVVQLLGGELDLEPVVGLHTPLLDVRVLLGRQLVDVAAAGRVVPGD